MVLHRGSRRIEHCIFSDLPSFLSPRDCLVINRTYVLPAKFTARRRTGGRIDGLFIREDSPGCWSVLLSGAGRIKEGETLGLERAGTTMTLVRRGERGCCEVRVDPPRRAIELLEALGTTPLPPYIQRHATSTNETDASDREYYQTVYAKSPGSIAAPTAGMHFTPELLYRIRAAGTAVVEVVLHIGLGTFQPVEVADLAEHHMHSEWYDLSPESAAALEGVRSAGGRIIAVGTTSVRVLETCARTGRLMPQSGWTDLLIYPPYQFRATDALLTNFHLPQSTLLALVFAFAGRDVILGAYQRAIAEGYRFYSYGDAMLIL